MKEAAPSILVGSGHFALIVASVRRHYRDLPTTVSPVHYCAKRRENYAFELCMQLFCHSGSKWCRVFPRCSLLSSLQFVHACIRMHACMHACLHAFLNVGGVVILNYYLAVRSLSPVATLLATFHALGEQMFSGVYGQTDWPALAFARFSTDEASQPFFRLYKYSNNCVCKQ